MIRDDTAAAAPADVETSGMPQRLTPRHLEHALEVLRDVSLSVDDGRTWRIIHGALTAPSSAALNARLEVIEHQLHQALSIITTPAPMATCLGDGLVFLPTSLGFPLIGFADDLQLTPSLLMHRKWDEPTTHALERIIHPGDHFLDIGANIGYFTVFGAALVGGTGCVHAFEPNPRTHDVLTRNVRMNNISHVCTLHGSALGDRVGSAAMHTFVRNQGSSTLSTLPDRLLDEWHERPVEHAVSMTTLDEVFAGRDEVFSCIKIDAEGSEGLIWAGGTRFFQTHVADHALILLEWNPPALGADRHALMAHFIRHGFSIWRRNDRLELTRITHVAQLDDWCIAELVLARDHGRVAAVFP